MGWLDHRGSLSPATVYVGQRVRIHYATRSETDTGLVRATDGHWADVELDGFEGRLVVPLLVSEMDELTDA